MTDKHQHHGRRERVNYRRDSLGHIVFIKQVLTMITHEAEEMPMSLKSNE